MFDFGFGELLLIAVIALVVLGPERLPVAARLAGLWIRKARTQWNAVKAELENELADEELRRNLREASAALHDSVQQARALPEALRNAPAATDAATTMTAIDPAAAADPRNGPVASTSTSSPVSATIATDAPASGDTATPAERDPAQMSLLDEIPAAQMDLLPRAPWPHPDE
jgi:sec-independent protein translocase protein TatB